MLRICLLCATHATWIEKTNINEISIGLKYARTRSERNEQQQLSDSTALATTIRCKLNLFGNDGTRHYFHARNETIRISSYWIRRFFLLLFSIIFLFYVGLDGVCAIKTIDGLPPGIILHGLYWRLLKVASYT